MEKCCTWDNGSVWLKGQPCKIYVGQWPIFHGPLFFALYHCHRLKLFVCIKKWHWPGVFVSLCAFALVHYKLVYNLSLLFLFGIWFYFEQKQPKIIAHLTNWWRFDVSDASLVLSAVKLNQIFHKINILNMKKAHNNDQEDHTKKLYVCHFCIAFKVYNFWLLTPSMFFGYPDHRFGGWFL